MKLEIEFNTKEELFQKINDNFLPLMIMNKELSKESQKTDAALLQNQNVQAVPTVQQTVPQNVPQPMQMQQMNAQPVIATTEHVYTNDELAKAAVTLMESGRQAELQQLLISFSVNSIPELPQDKRGAFATALREKGAQI